MNINEITLGGYTVADLKKMQGAVQKDANKFIADNLGKGTALVKEIIEGRTDDCSMSEEEAVAKAEEAHAILKAVNLVSGVSGVSYYLDWEPEWQDDVLSAQLDGNAEFSFDVYSYGETENAVQKLYSLLTEMESDSQGWHDSTC